MSGVGVLLDSPGAGTALDAGTAALGAGTAALGAGSLGAGTAALALGTGSVLLAAPAFMLEGLDRGSRHAGLVRARARARARRPRALFKGFLVARRVASTASIATYTQRTQPRL